MLKPKKKILFIGYNRGQTKIIDALIQADCEVHHTDMPFNQIDYDCIISFGYRHILKQGFLDKLKCPIFNLHIAYLPYNRGAHPNFWSFYDNTPSGVTIHLIDAGIDTGPIVYQKYVNFDKGEQTFSQTYGRLVCEIEDLLISNLKDILDGNWTSKNQRGCGTFHHVRDLPKNFTGWKANINDELYRLDNNFS